MQDAAVHHAGLKTRRRPSVERTPHTQTGERRMGSGREEKREPLSEKKKAVNPRKREVGCSTELRGQEKKLPVGMNSRGREARLGKGTGPMRKSRKCGNSQT